MHYLVLWTNGHTDQVFNVFIITLTCTYVPADVLTSWSWIIGVALETCISSCPPDVTCDLLDVINCANAAIYIDSSKYRAFPPYISEAYIRPRLLNWKYCYSFPTMAAKLPNESQESCLSFHCETRKAICFAFPGCVHITTWENNIQL